MATTTDIPLPKHKREVIERAVIRFAGDSGDGMQVTGSQFTNTVALDGKSISRCKNFFALGMCYWLYNRSMDGTKRYIEDKFAKKPLLVEANKLAMKAGYSYCEATEAFQISYEIPPAQLEPGLYRNMSGNQALALGFITASQKSGLKLFQGSYPITPASDILHELSQYKDFGVMTFQAEDEIAAITSAIGA